MKIDKITVKGEKHTASAHVGYPQELITLEATYLLGGGVRGSVVTHQVELGDDNLLELVFEDETRWFCDAYTLDEVFPEANLPRRSADGTFEIPHTLPEGIGERGRGNLVIKVLNLFTRKAVQVSVGELAERFENSQLGGNIGLFRLTDAFQLQPYTLETVDTPYLLFIHGTASSTAGSFGGVMGTDFWLSVKQQYREEVLAFQHRTLTESPLENVLALVRQLPQNARLHIVSHSRGGLVGEILSRFGNPDENYAGFDALEMCLLEKEGRAEDVTCIEKIREAMRGKRLRVEKFVRVACPAGGTTLASRRLDIFLNAILNLIGYGTGVGATPAYGILKDLLAAAVGTKDKVDVLPGLEAQNPDSPFIKVLNNPSSKILLDSPLAVVSGNCRVKVNFKALLVILSKIFYLRQNDLIVDTASMELGTRRVRPPQVYFENATDIDHFHYFKNERTRQAIRQALLVQGDAVPAGFSTLPADVLTGNMRHAALGLEGGEVFKDTVTGKKPILVLLPGIMGSSLHEDGDLVWINYWQFLTGGLVRLGMDNGAIKAPALVGSSYRKFVEFMGETYDVVTFPFDWRKQLYTLADLLNAKMQQLLAFRVPVKIVAHSMGGVLVRDFMVKHPATWEQLNRSTGFRAIFLGAPLGGSYRIPSVLFGEDAIIRKLGKLDIRHSTKELLQVFSKLPGLLSLLPFTTHADHDFSRQETWLGLREAFGDGDWPLPEGEDLAVFKEYRDGVLAALPEADYSNCFYIAGRDKATPCGYRMEGAAGGGRRLVFLSTAEGDQSVTWDSGIPRELVTAGRVYYVNVTHGSLANEPSIFKGITELLAYGATALLSRQRPVVRAQDMVFRSPEQLDLDLTPQGVERTLLGLTSPGEKEGASNPPLEVTVCHGDLRFSTYPVLVGHFQGDGLVFAEKTIDRYMNGMPGVRQEYGLYPGEIGTNGILLSPEGGFAGALVVGLGQSGSLTAFQLTKTVEQGILNYALTRASQEKVPGAASSSPLRDGVSALLVGSGYGGLAIENSVRAIVEGVQNANRKIVRLAAQGCRPITHLEFIEQIEHFALGAFYSARKIAREESNPSGITIHQKKLKVLIGAKQQLPTEATVGWWNRVTVTLPKATAMDGLPRLRFSSSTGGAREELTEVVGSLGVLEALLSEISEHNQWSAASAKALFELLIPNNFKDQLKRHGNITWVLDDHTAAYPWELLQDVTGDGKPLCIHAGMIRQLATEDFRQKVVPVVANRALVVADPNLKGMAGMSQLPGALAEGASVKRKMEEGAMEVVPNFNGSEASIIRDLFSGDYKIIHLAGHGVFNPSAPESSGMVIGPDLYLTAGNINQMGTVPELVFVNCCYLGKSDAAAETLSQQRYRLAANIGPQLIRNGVKAVLVAGWAVEDNAALLFAEAFYDHMFSGYTFGDAVLFARKAVYDRYRDSSNTWGAYQAYGNQFYRLTDREMADQAYEPEFVVSQQAEIELGNLLNELDALRYTKREVLARVAAIAEAVDRAGIRDAKITEREALVYAELAEYDLALSKLEELMQEEKATFSIWALERYYNLQAKKMVKDSREGKKVANASTAFRKLIGQVNSLLQLSRTAERYSLLASTYKRKALFQAGEQKAASYALAAANYKLAYLTPGCIYRDYALTNWLELESVLTLAGHPVVDSNGEPLAAVPQTEALALLDKAEKELEDPYGKMDYWFLVSKANLLLCRIILQPASLQNRQSSEGAFLTFQRIWGKAGSEAKKIAEMEHLEMLLDALHLGQVPELEALRGAVQTLMGDLRTML